MSGLRIGFVGAGRIADYHRRAIERLGARARLVAFCEPRDETRVARRREWGVPGYASMEDLLARERLDAVYILVPHDAHLKTVELAAGAGLSVMLEKPIAVSRAEGQRIVQLASTTPGVFMVGHNSLFHPAFHDRAAEAVRRGWIGKPLFARGDSSGWIDLKPWDFRTDRAKTGGGCWMDTASHLICPMRHLLGEIDQIDGFCANLVRKEMQGDDHAVASIRFRSGALGQIFASYGHKSPRSDQPWPEGYTMNLEVAGDRGSLSYSALPHPRIALHSEIEEGKEASQRWLSVVEEPFSASFDHESEHFVGCIETGARPRVSAQDGLAVLVALLSFYENADTANAGRKRAT